MALENIDIDAIYSYLRQASRDERYKTNCAHQVSRRFGISVEEARKSLELLKSMDLVIETMESFKSPAGYMEWIKVYEIKT